MFIRHRLLGLGRFGNTKNLQIGGTILHTGNKIKSTSVTFESFLSADTTGTPKFHAVAKITLSAVVSL